MEKKVETKENIPSYKRKVELGEDKRQLSEKEISQLMFESFKFSQGRINLQFMYLLLAFNYYGPQEFDDKKVRENFIKNLGIGSEENINEDNFMLANKQTHKEVSDSNLKEMTDIGVGSIFSPAALQNFLDVLKTGRTYFGRQEGRDFSTVVTIKQEELVFQEFLSAITKTDFYYFFGDRKIAREKGRPNRKEENIGSNKLNDRYFSFLIWHIILGKADNFKFSEMVYKKLREEFVNWFNSLSDHGLIGLGQPYGGGLKMENHYYSPEREITKDNIIELITIYNDYHPKTMLIEESLREMGCKF